MTDETELRPVAWRVKDFADGWIMFHNEESARREAQVTGALMQPLYTRAPDPVVVRHLDQEDISMLRRALAGSVKYVKPECNCDKLAAALRDCLIWIEVPHVKAKAKAALEKYEKSYEN